MPLQTFYDTGDVYISEQEAYEILFWFFGGGVALSPAQLTENDRSFAQALMFEAIRKSKQVGWFEDLFRGTANPTQSIRKTLKNVAKFVGQALWDKLKASDLNNPKVYEMIKNQLTRNWRSVWKIRVATEAPVY